MPISGTHNNLETLVDQPLVEPITFDQLAAIARCPWMRELNAELQAVCLTFGYRDGIACMFGGHLPGHRTIELLLGPAGYPRLVLDISEENLFNLYPPGYVAEFLLVLSERDMTPLGPTRIGPTLAGIGAHFERLHPPYLVRHLLPLLEPTQAA